VWKKIDWSAPYLYTMLTFKKYNWKNKLNVTQYGFQCLNYNGSIFMKETSNKIIKLIFYIKINIISNFYSLKKRKWLEYSRKKIIQSNPDLKNKIIVDILTCFHLINFILIYLCKTF